MGIHKFPGLAVTLIASAPSWADPYGDSITNRPIPATEDQRESECLYITQQAARQKSLFGLIESIDGSPKDAGIYRFILEQHLQSLSARDGILRCGSGPPAPSNPPPRATPTVQDGRADLQLGECDKSFAIFKELAIKGDKDAQYLLARSYESGWGTVADPKGASPWYQKAADQGQLQAESTLGFCYQTGCQGIDANPALGMSLIRKAAEQREPGAELNLGLAYLTGKGVKTDNTNAVLWLGHAAEDGNLLAQLVLGNSYGKGDLVPKNDVQSLKWLTIAAMDRPELTSSDKLIRDRAKQMSDELVKSLDAKRQVEAQRLASDWILQHMQSPRADIDSLAINCKATGFFAPVPQ